MKIKILLLIISLIFSTKYLKSGTWKELDSVRVYGEGRKNPYSVIFMGIDCIDSINCIVTGNLGLISPFDRHTSNGGETWHTTLIDTVKIHYNPDSTIDWIYTPPSVNGVDYISSDLCIVIGDLGYYWRSEDGLNTWNKFKLKTDKDNINIDFFDEGKGGIVSLRDLSLTKDSGITWFEPEIDIPQNLYPSTFKDISIPDSNSIISLVYRQENDENIDYILRSLDYGKSWVAYDKTPRRINKIFFINKDIGWACGKHQIEPLSSKYKDIILHTTNGGRSWDIQLDTLASINKGLRYIYFLDSLNGVAYGSYWKIWITSNGGKTWERDFSAQEQLSFDISHVHIPSKSSIYACSSDDGKILKYVTRTSIKDNSSQHREFDLKIYPNPVSSGEEINIEITRKFFSHIELEIYNSTGIKIDKSYNAFLNNGTKKIKYIPDKNLSQGVYFLHVKIGKEKFVEKFVVIE